VAFGNLLEALDSRSRVLLWHLWWHRHAGIAELREAIDAQSDFEVLHRLNACVNGKAQELLGGPIAGFEQARTDPVSGETVTFSWWFLDEDVPPSEGPLVDVFEEGECVTVIAHLPAQVEVDGPEIACRNGVLRVRLRKAERG